MNDQVQPAIRPLLPALGHDITWLPERSIDEQGARRTTQAFGRMIGVDVPPLRSAKAHA